jgi:hypothetical protein
MPHERARELGDDAREPGPDGWGPLLFDHAFAAGPLTDEQSATRRYVSTGNASPSDDVLAIPVTAGLEGPPLRCRPGR